MRAVVQRVSEASVTVAGKAVGRTGPGFLVLLCAMRGDDRVKAEQMAAKIVKLRIFEDDAGKMNLSLRDTGGSVLLVSQFTLGADTRGNRPGFTPSAPPEEAEPLYLHVADRIRAEGIPVETGVFGAEMRVALVNEGPVTIWLDL